MGNRAFLLEYSGYGIFFLITFYFKPSLFKTFQTSVMAENTPNKQQQGGQNPGKSGSGNQPNPGKQQDPNRGLNQDEDLKKNTGTNPSEQDRRNKEQNRPGTPSQDPNKGNGGNKR
jgi:hypothetical protein